MANAYTKTIEFKAIDASVKRAVRDLSRGIGGIEKKVDKVNKNFTALNKALKGISTEFKQIANTLTKIEKIGKTGSNSTKELSKSAQGIKTLIRLKKQLSETGPLFSGEGKSKPFQTSLNSIRKVIEALGTSNLEMQKKLQVSFAATEAGLARQAATFNTIAVNTRFAKDSTGVYTQAIQGMTKAEQALRFAQLERLKIQKNLYLSGEGDGFKNVSTLLAKFGTIGKSGQGSIDKNIASLSIYKGELQRALTLVELHGKEYRQIQGTIGKINNLLEGKKKKEKEVEETTEKELTWSQKQLKVEKAILEVVRQKGKIARQDLGNLGKFLGGIGRVFSGKAAGGWLNQAAHIVGVSDAVQRLVKRLNLLQTAQGRVVKNWALILQRGVEGVTGVKLAAIGLGKVLGAADWVGGAIQGFIQFEKTAANIIWSIERNYRSAFSSMGRMVRELPMLASAAMMMMPEWMGGKGMKGNWLADGGPVEMTSVMDQIAGDRLAQRRPSRVQRMERIIGRKSKRLESLNVEDPKFVKLKREILNLEFKITQEKVAQNAIFGKVSYAEQISAKKALENQKRKTLELQNQKSIILSTKQIENQRQLLMQRKGEAVHLPGRGRRDPFTGERGDYVNRDVWKRYQRMKKSSTSRAGRQLRESQAMNARFRENLMLGAGFPILFGGGVGSVAGGTTGAILQSKMGAGAGFGAQILLSAVGQSIDAFVVKTAEMGKALGDFTKDTGALTEALGLAGTAEGQRIKNIEAAEGKQAAFNATVKRLTATIGETGVQRLKDFGDKWTDLMMSMQSGMLKLQSALAGVLLGIDRIFGWSKAARDKRIMTFAREQGNTEVRGLIKKYDEMPSSFKFRDKKADLKSRIIEGTMGDFDKMTATAATDKLYGPGTKTAELDAQILQLEQVFQLGEKQSIIEEKIRNMKRDGVSLSEKEYRKKLETIDALTELNGIYQQIGQTIENGIVSAIEGAIQGTRTLGDVARSVFSEIASQMIRLGVSNLMGGLGAGLFGPKAAPKGPLGNTLSQHTTKYYPGMERANGGPVKGGSSYIVGEEGPELFVPRSSGNIIPNDAMGGANIVVNVDASGSSVEGDEAQSRELGNMLAAAIQAELVRQKRPGGLLV